MARNLTVGFGTLALGAWLAAWLPSPSATAQTSSLFRKGLPARTVPTPEADTAATANTATAAAAPTTQPASPYGTVLSMSGPTEPAAPVAAIGAPMSGPAAAAKAAGPAAAAGMRDATLTPAAIALQRTSFTAITAPEPRTYQVHDLITVIVREETSFATDGQTDLKKEANLDAKLVAWMKLHAGNPPLKSVPMETTPQLKSEATREFTGDGKVKRKDTFIGRLTAEVIDVKPNGTLLVAAKKFIQTDEEQQYFELSGLCRLADIGADNTILSTQLADLTVTKTHKGAVRDSTKRGWLPWITDKLNPW